MVVTVVKPGNNQFPTKPKQTLHSRHCSIGVPHQQELPMHHSLAVIAFAALSTSAAAVADDPTPQNRFGMGVTVYNGSAEYRDYDESLVGLNFYYRGDQVFVDEDEIGFNFVPDRNYRIEALLKRQHFGYDADDSGVF